MKQSDTDYRHSEDQDNLISEQQQHSGY